MRISDRLLRHVMFASILLQAGVVGANPGTVPNQIQVDNEWIPVPPAANNILSHVLRPGKHTLHYRGIAYTAVVGIAPAAAVGQGGRDVAFASKAWVQTFLGDDPEPLIARIGNRRLEKVSGRFTLTLPYGVHRLRFVNPFYKDREIVVEVTPTEPNVPIGVKLELKDSYLRVLGAPRHAYVTVDGARELLSDEPIAVSHGDGIEHEVTIHALGSELLSQVVKLTPGETTTIDLRPADGSCRPEPTTAQGGH